MNRILPSPILLVLMILFRILLFWLASAACAMAEDTAVVLRMLKSLEGQSTVSVMDSAWPYLDSENSAIREAARAAIQKLPFSDWRDRAIEEKGTWASLEVLRALVESCPAELARELSPHLCEQITTLRIEHMDEAQLLAAQRLTRFVFDRLGPVSEDERHQMLDLWTALPVPLGDTLARERTGLIEFLTAVRSRQP